jgi:hypothetical protein
MWLEIHKLFLVGYSTTFSVPRPYSVDNRMIMNAAQMVEWKWQGKPKYSEKTLSSYTSSTTNTTWPVIEPGLPRWESGD